jgi:hypothetical protein
MVTTKTINIDINKYPDLKNFKVPNNISSINFGSMHCNVLKLLHSLIAYRIIKMDKSKYEEFVSFYDQNRGWFTTKEGEDRKFSHATKDMISACTSLLNKIKVLKNTNCSFRLFGGLLKGNPTHKFFIAKILEKLYKKGIKYTIILNEGDLISYQEYFNNCNSNLLFEKYTFKKGKLIDYEIDEENKAITIHTSAPANLKKIIELASTFIVKNRKKTNETNKKNTIEWNSLEDFKENIKEVNVYFQAYLARKDLFDDYIKPILKKINQPPTKYSDLLVYLFANKSIESRHFDENYKYNGYKIKYVFSKNILDTDKDRSHMTNLYCRDKKNKKKKKNTPNKHQLKVHTSYKVSTPPTEKSPNEKTNFPNTYPKKTFFEKPHKPPKKETWLDIIKHELLGLFYQLVPRFLLNIAMLFNCCRQREDEKNKQTDTSTYEKIARCFQYKG